ncbi:uncharacterized protein B0H18DRAFT_969293 [Fomitopsis serialis]|uniref:uncharacterized protein n=1 Tax=Fomitopsis serialis TaxID=139415 RepID=UPI002007EC05|nr:uncharacterized protein B0H18DRAFT_969293 [Neoantrodia serialis]KAH9937143.1 hypothetical protein B0H18DRAFT_969293 [Neoantrodia serialis]
MDGGMRNDGRINWMTGRAQRRGNWERAGPCRSSWERAGPCRNSWERAMLCRNVRTVVWSVLTATSEQFLL